MTTHPAYAGIGSRETPPNVLLLMELIGQSLADKGYLLRSGGAQGADSAFERGVRASTAPDAAEIYLPWPGFNRHPGGIPLNGLDNWAEACDLAAKFHPAWHRCGVAARKFHTRNMYQVLGMDLNTPARFVICWTVNGAVTGGTGQAMRIAKAYEVPICNLAVSTDNELISVLLRD